MYDYSTADTLEFHRSMVHDRLRSDQFLKAIMEVIKPGDVVIDIGCGTGILSLFACMAGAGHVFAFEQDPIIDLARQVAEQNGYASRITFINEWSTGTDLPQKADVLISETIGNLGFDEGIAGWIADASKRLLKPDARLIPAAVSVILAPVENEGAYDSVAGWNSDLYALQFDAARSAAANTIWWADHPAVCLLAEPFSFWRLDLQDETPPTLQNETVFELSRDGTVYGLGLWFSVELAPGISVSSAPPNQAPSWQHGFLPLERPLALEEGDRLHVTLAMSANGASWEWRVTPCDSENNAVGSQQNGRAGIPGKKPGHLAQDKG